MPLFWIFVGGITTHLFEKYYEEVPTLLYQENSKWKVTCFNSGNKVAKLITVEVTFDKNIKNGSITYFVPRIKEISSSGIVQKNIYELQITRLHSRFNGNKSSKQEEIRIINNDESNSVSLISFASDETIGQPDPSYSFTKNEWSE
jgi:hypothetical protein